MNPLVSGQSTTLARPPRITVPLASVLFVVTAVGGWRYVTGHHCETNLRNLGSAETVELQQATAWTRKFDQAFGSGIAGGFAIVVADRCVRPVHRRRVHVAARRNNADR